MNEYKYKPITYFGLTFLFTWANWFISVYFSRTSENEGLYILFMSLGLLAPATIAIIMILASKNKQIKRDYVNKAVSIKRIKPSTFVAMVLIMPFAVVASILISTLFGQPLNQLVLADKFSFSFGTMPTLAVLLLTAFFEEFGWRGYAMDSLLSRYNLFTATWIFAIIWSLWHLPLFLIAGSYQYNILQENIWFGINFIISTIPLAFILSWLCARNRGSILAAILFHFFVNIMQEATNMNQISKCIETVVLAVIAVAVVVRNKELFFNKATVNQGETSLESVQAN